MGFETIQQTKGDNMNEAMAALAAIEAQVHAMGANDSETSLSGDFAQIRRRLEMGEITAGDALAQAEGVRDSKQAYH